MDSTLGGERKFQVLTWSGAPNFLRQWHKKLLLRPNGWGLRLYAAFTDDAKRLADTELMEELIIERGYLAILTALMSKYKPYLEAVEPSKEAPRNPSSGKSEFTRRKKHIGRLRNI